MRILQKLMYVLAAAATAGLLSYEIVCKSMLWPCGPLPGWHEARRAERGTPFVPRTGHLPVDRLLHEGQEAVAYYSFLLRRGPRPLSRVSRSPRIVR